MHTYSMIATHPHVRGGTNDTLVHCIDECFDCAQACTACADACLGEPAVHELVQCIRLNLDCADICVTTATVASRRTGSNEVSIRQMLEACAMVCQMCANECARHAGRHEHCRICMEVCRTCEQLCRDAAKTLAPRMQ
ncbi:four-helix bundle copper-binding protein [uncultured Ferrovibrio sp.]|jgi:hypothetical protein|uniref:four-helix bundle copper-binding protein n=1 Tax=uncultured Ferrovibrio sp. TaxID=1576913 RepID=UPI00260238CD|nr:four-helix bundle copper-binding protein [uncultured Ferrovibrio sp.]